MFAVRLYANIGARESVFKCVRKRTNENAHRNAACTGATRGGMAAPSIVKTDRARRSRLDPDAMGAQRAVSSNCRADAGG